MSKLYEALTDLANAKRERDSAVTRAAGLFTCEACGGECDTTPCECGKPAAKTTAERVNKLRKDRAALGLKRKEVYVHDDDWPELLKLAKRLERRRAKLLASGAG